ncbi:hypothetical protein J6E39_05875 [bacterium]|nr:hypothetical protein [bacterium]
MVERIEGITDKDDLKKAQAAAQAQGTSITNYNEWNDILNSLDEAGVQSTGSYAGDKAKLQEIEQAIRDYMEEVQVEDKSRQEQGKEEQSQGLAKNDKEQVVKANMANATSSVILADYMKYYHLLS